MRASLKKHEYGLAALVGGLLFWGTLQFAFRGFRAGVWAHTAFDQVSGMFLISGLLALLLLVPAYVEAWKIRRMPLYVIVTLLGFWSLRATLPDPRARFDAEQLLYESAMRTGTAYGKQHQEAIDGRTLTYWHWNKIGVDNASGIIYDPEDRLDRKGKDRNAFQKATGGVIMGSTRYAPCWYFVSHS